MNLSNNIQQFAAIAVFCSAIALGCSSSPEPADEEPVGDKPAEMSVEEPAAEESPAQAPQAEEPSEEIEALAAQVSDEDLQMFAAAARAVADREKELEEQGRDLDTLMGSATTPGERVGAEQEVLAEYQEAVAEVGVDYDAFMNMGQIIRQHPGLLERLEEYLDDAEIEAFFGP